jgi:hypothetical protein
LARSIFIALLVLISAAAATAAPTYAAGSTGAPAERQKTPIATSTPGTGCSETPHRGDLRARITDHPDSTTAQFTNRSASCSYQIGLAVYKKFDDNIDHQELYDHTAAVIGPGETVDLGVSNPPCAYQADAFWGDVITSFAGGQRYGPRRLADSDGGTDYCGVSQPSATPSPTGTPAAPPTDTPVPPTDTPVPPTNTPVPPSATPTLPVKGPTDTPVPPTETAVPPTETAVPPTETIVPPAVVPTDTPVPPTDTATPVPPVVPTDTPVVPVVVVVPTDTPAPPVVVIVATSTPAPPQATVARPTTPPGNTTRPPSRPPATIRRPANPPAASTAPVSRALPLIGSEAGPQVLPLTGGASDLYLMLALVVGAMVSLIGVLLRRRAAPDR